MHVLSPIDESMSAVAGGPENPISVSVTNRSEIQKVSLTNPGLTNAQLRGAPLEVVVNNLPGTGGVQTVHVDNLPATQAVTVGNFPAQTALTDVQMRASPVAVTVGNFPATQTVTVANFPTSNGLTDAQLRAAPLAVTGTFYPAVQPVSGTITVSNPTPQGLTDTQLRAAPVPVSGAFYPATQPVSGSLSVSNFPAFTGVTDTQLRATPLPVTGTVTLSNPTPQGLTDAQLRATPILAKSVSLDLFGTAVTGTVTTTAQTIAALAASLWAAGATHVVAVAAGAGRGRCGAACTLRGLNDPQPERAAAHDPGRGGSGGRQGHGRDRNGRHLWIQVRPAQVAALVGAFWQSIY